MSLSAFAAHPKPRSAHIQRLAPTGTAVCQCKFIYLSFFELVRLTLSFCYHSFTFVLLVTSGLVTEPVFLYLKEQCTDLEVRIHSLSLTSLFCSRAE